MKVVVSEKSQIERELEVSVESGRVQQSWDKHLRDVIRNVSIPGFRRGKAPRAIVERYANREQLQRTVFEEIGVPAYQQALQQEKLAPLGEPNVELVQFEPGKDLIFKATIEVKPEIELAAEEYADLEVEVQKIEVTDEDVGHILEDFQKRATRTVTVDEDRPLQEGDIAVVDIEGKENDQVVAAVSGENIQAMMNDDLFFPGFDKNLEGMKVDEKREFDATFPDDFRGQELAGKTLHFTTHLKTIKKREVPELDDDFAREVSRFSSLDELKADVRARLERNVKLEIGHRAIYKIAEKRSDIPVPRAFSNNVIMHTLENQARQLQQYGIKFEDYLRQQGIDPNVLVERMRPDAEVSARAEMVLDAIARKQAVVVSDEELESEITQFAAAQNRGLEEVKAELAKQEHTENFRADVVRQRVLIHVAGHARPFIPEPKTEEAPAEEATASEAAAPTESTPAADASAAEAEPTEATPAAASASTEKPAKPARKSKAKAAEKAEPSAEQEGEAGEAG